MPNEPIKQGYKLTEIGVIPHDWEVVEMGKIGEPIIGLTYQPSNVCNYGLLVLRSSNIKNNRLVFEDNVFVGKATSHYTNNKDGVLYIQGYNVKENSFNFHGIKYVTQSFHEKHSKSCLQENDLLTIQTGEIGVTTIVNKKLKGSNCHALIISRFNQNIVFPKFISYYFNSFHGRSRLKLIETGTTMKHLNIGDMLEFFVPLPPTKEEQGAIASILTDMDREIEGLEEKLEKYRQIKQGMMEELLTGKIRL